MNPTGEDKRQAATRVEDTVWNVATYILWTIHAEKEAGSAVSYYATSTSLNRVKRGAEII